MTQRKAVSEHLPRVHQDLLLRAMTLPRFDQLLDLLDGAEGVNLNGDRPPLQHTDKDVYTGPYVPVEEHQLSVDHVTLFDLIGASSGPNTNASLCTSSSNSFRPSFRLNGVHQHNSNTTLMASQQSHRGPLFCSCGLIPSRMRTRIHRGSICGKPNSTHHPSPSSR